MIQFAIFFYGILAMFVTLSIQRNAREQRTHSRALTMAGWSVMSSSATLGVLLLAYVAYCMMTGATPPAL